MPIHVAPHPITGVYVGPHKATGVYVGPHTVWSAFSWTDDFNRPDIGEKWKLTRNEITITLGGTLSHSTAGDAFALMYYVGEEAAGEPVSVALPTPTGGPGQGSLNAIGGIGVRVDPDANTGVWLFMQEGGTFQFARQAGGITPGYFDKFGTSKAQAVNPNDRIRVVADDPGPGEYSAYLNDDTEPFHRAKDPKAAPSGAYSGLVLVARGVVYDEFLIGEGADKPKPPEPLTLPLDIDLATGVFAGDLIRHRAFEAYGTGPSPVVRDGMILPGSGSGLHWAAVAPTFASPDGQRITFRIADPRKAGERWDNQAATAVFVLGGDTLGTSQGVALSYAEPGGKPMLGMYQLRNGVPPTDPSEPVVIDTKGAVGWDTEFTLEAVRRGSELRFRVLRGTTELKADIPPWRDVSGLRAALFTNRTSSGVGPGVSRLRVADIHTALEPFEPASDDFQTGGGPASGSTTGGENELGDKWQQARAYRPRVSGWSNEMMVRSKRTKVGQWAASPNTRKSSGTATAMAKVPLPGDDCEVHWWVTQWSYSNGFDDNDTGENVIFLRANDDASDNVRFMMRARSVAIGTARNGGTVSDWQTASFTIKENQHLFARARGHTYEFGYVEGKAEHVILSRDIPEFPADSEHRYVGMAFGRDSGLIYADTGWLPYDLETYVRAPAPEVEREWKWQRFDASGQLVLNDDTTEFEVVAVGAGGGGGGGNGSSAYAACGGGGGGGANTSKKYVATEVWAAGHTDRKLSWQVGTAGSGGAKGIDGTAGGPSTVYAEATSSGQRELITAGGGGGGQAGKGTGDGGSKGGAGGTGDISGGNGGRGRNGGGGPTSAGSSSASGKYAGGGGGAGGEQAGSALSGGKGGDTSGGSSGGGTGGSNTAADKFHGGGGGGSYNSNAGNKPGGNGGSPGGGGAGGAAYRGSWGGASGGNGAGGGVWIGQLTAK